ncbi:MAG: HEAT repeat domain-containing protein [Chloroflexota bacterium]
MQQFLSELTSGDDWRAEAAVQALAALSGEQVESAFAALRALLEAPDADQRWWAGRALAALQHPDVVGQLLVALGDPDAAVRQCGALGLRLHPDPQAVSALVAALDDTDSLVGDLVGEALAAIGAPAVPALLAVMQAGSRRARLKAVRALAAIGDQRSIPALFAALDEDSALMEYWASEGLEKMGVGMAFFLP